MQLLFLFQQQDRILLRIDSLQFFGIFQRPQVLLAGATLEGFRIPLLEVFRSFIGDFRALAEAVAVLVVILIEVLRQAAVPYRVGDGIFLRSRNLLVEDAVGGVRAVVVFLAKMADLVPFLGDRRLGLGLSGGGDDGGDDDHGGGD